MFKRFDDYAEALKFGREFSEKNGCHTVCVTVYVEVCGPMPQELGTFRQSQTVAFVASPSSYHKLHGLRGASCSPGSGWYFGEIGRSSGNPYAAMVMEEADEPALPGKGEWWFGLFAGHTTGFTTAELREMSAEAEKNNTGVWHESAMLARRKNPDMVIKCQCGKCNPKPPAPVASKPARKTRLGRHSGY